MAAKWFNSLDTNSSIVAKNCGCLKNILLTLSIHNINILNTPQQYCFENINWHKQNFSGPLAQILEELYQTICNTSYKSHNTQLLFAWRKGAWHPHNDATPLFFHWNNKYDKHRNLLMVDPHCFFEISISAFISNWDKNSIIN